MAPDYEQLQAQKIASRNRGLATVLGFLAPPIGYAYVDSWGLAALNFITLNYLLLGFVIVPLHVRRIHAAAVGRLDDA